MKRLIAAEKGEDSDEIPSVPPPIQGDVHDAIRTWMNFRLHHVYPEAGGYNDQDADLMEDWSILNIWYIRLDKGVELYAELENTVPFPNVTTMMHD